MTQQKVTYQIPPDKTIISEESIGKRKNQLTYPWELWAERMGNLGDVLRELADQVEDEAIDPTTATATDNAAILSRVFDKLQELV